MKKLFRLEFNSGVRNAALLALALAMASGCFWREKETSTDPAFTVRPVGSQTNLIITPAPSAMGRVSSVNQAGNFAVVSFPIGQVPANGTKLSIYRAAQKVGEMKISGPAADTLTVGDITVGVAQEGDEVRAE